MIEITYRLLQVGLIVLLHLLIWMKFGDNIAALGLPIYIAFIIYASKVRLYDYSKVETYKNTFVYSILIRIALMGTFYLIATSILWK